MAIWELFSAKAIILFLLVILLLIAVLAILAKSKEKLNEVLSSLVAFSKFHFETEEQYIEKLKNIEAQEHKNKHLKMLNEIESLAEKQKKLKTKILDTISILS